AVAVGGGAEKVFEPREPKLARGRASASVTTMVNTAATVNTASNGRNSFIRLSQSPVGRPEYRGWEPICEGPPLRPDRAAGASRGAPKGVKVAQRRTNAGILREATMRRVLAIMFVLSGVVVLGGCVITLPWVAGRRRAASNVPP